jgi:hypothetical protein
VTKAGLGRRTGLIGVGSLAGSGLLALALGGTWTATTHALAAIPLVTIAAAALLPGLWHSPHPPETTPPRATERSDGSLWALPPAGAAMGLAGNAPVGAHRRGR